MIGEVHFPRLPEFRAGLAMPLCLFASTVRSQTVADSVQGNALLSPRPFLHIPGPNPIISRGAKGSWDEYYIEAGDVIKDSATYYFYYHGTALDLQRWGRRGYRIGVATASHPLGPWTKDELYGGTLAYAERLKREGARYELILLDGAPHGMENWAGHVEWEFYKTRMIDWLHSTLGANRNGSL